MNARFHEILAGRKYSIDPEVRLEGLKRYVRVVITGPKLTEHEDFEVAGYLIRRVKGLFFDNFAYVDGQNVYLFEIERARVARSVCQRIRETMPCSELRLDMAV